MILPVALDVENRAVLVIGGGPVAARKAAAFLESGALVTVVSPGLAADFPPVTHRAKKYESTDLDGFSLVCACTNAQQINAQIAADAKERKIWCNIADAPRDSDFHTCAIVRRDEIAIGISTNGLSPILSRHLMSQIEGCIGPEYGQLLDLVRPLKIETAQRGAFWRALLASDVLDFLRSNEQVMAAQTIQTLVKSLTPR